MTFLDKLKPHKGGLIKLKTQLFWYGDRSYDKNSGRICLLLDVVSSHPHALSPRAAASSCNTNGVDGFTAIALLLIDGKPQWVWIAEQDIDLLVNDPPTN